jgi:hypothetical protein
MASREAVPLRRGLLASWDRCGVDGDADDGTEGDAAGLGIA